MNPPHPHTPTHTSYHSFVEGTYHVHTTPVTDHRGLHWTVVHMLHSDRVVPELSAAIYRCTVFCSCYGLVIFCVAVLIAYGLSAQLQHLSGRMSRLKQLEFDGLVSLVEHTGASRRGEGRPMGSISSGGSPSSLMLGSRCPSAPLGEGINLRVAAMQV